MPERVNVAAGAAREAKRQSAMFVNHETKAQALERKVREELSKRRKPDWSEEREIRESHKIRRELLGRAENADERKARLSAEKQERRYARRTEAQKRQALSNKHAMFRNPKSPRYVPNDKDGRGKDPTGRRDTAELRIARKIDGRGVSERPFRVRSKSFDRRFTTPKHALEFGLLVLAEYGEYPRLVHYGKKNFKRTLREVMDAGPWVDRFNVNVNGTILEQVALKA